MKMIKKYVAYLSIIIYYRTTFLKEKFMIKYYVFLILTLIILANHDEIKNQIVSFSTEIAK